jgi:hypothetical protein
MMLALLSGCGGSGVPAGTAAARNSFGHVGYDGPCPPSGEAHRYVITLLALSALSALKPGFSSGALTSLHALARGELRGSYRR